MNDRFITKDEYGYTRDCSMCPKHGDCYDSSDCVEVLSERLWGYEETGLSADELLKLLAQIEDAVSRTYLLKEYDRQHKGPSGGARKLIEEAPGLMNSNNT